MFYKLLMKEQDTEKINKYLTQGSLANNCKS